MSQPIVSIITVTLNSEATLEKTIQSVRKQTYTNIEYLIIDGNSSDGTIDVIKKNENIVDFWTSEKDSGLYDAMNKGINKSNGKLIGILNSDDVYLDSTVEKVVKRFEKTDNPSVFYGNMIKFYKKEKSLFKGDMSDQSFEKVDIQLNHPTCFIDRVLYKKYGTFDTSYETGADRELMLRLNNNGANFEHIDQVLAKFRMGGTTTKFSFSKSVRVARQAYLMFTRHGYSRPISLIHVAHKTLRNFIKALLTHTIGTKKLSILRIKWLSFKDNLT